MNVYLPNGRLPSAYQEVEYIGSSGTQYINTDIKLNQTHTIELKLNINSNLNQWDKFYGGGDNGSMLFAQYEKSSGTAIQNRIKITNKSSNNMYSTNPQTISAGGTHIFIHSNTSFYIDGVSQSTTTATTFTMNTGLNIFAMGNSQSTGREKSSYKLYYMKIYNSNSSLAYDLVPCYRKSDNVIGLYDLVNNQFYTNAGTGTFSKGNDVTMAELKNAYIGEYKVGIYHNAILGLISLSSDGENWITISDKNLGATTVYNTGDTLSEANCGKYYQWGNNYGFPRTGSVTTSTTRVNASTYGPGNYYNSSTFIYRPESPIGWDNSGNKNLRGGVTGTNEAMQGPCNSGYHIPTNTELQSIGDILKSLGISYGAEIYLKMPLAGRRNSNNSNIELQGRYGQYYASVGYSESGYSYCLTISNSIFAVGTTFTTEGESIRPFKNEAVQPDSSRTKLY